MPEHEAVDAIAVLIERVVQKSNLPSARARDDLRRELASHFDDALAHAAAGRAVDAVDAVDAVRASVERFGDAPAIASGFRRAYRPGRRALYAAKIAASVVVSAAVAIGLQVLAHLQVATGAAAVGLTAWYRPAVHVAVGLVVAAVAAWELGIEPLCTRLEQRPARLLAVVGALYLVVSVAHGARHDALDPADALVRTAATVAGWTSTLAVLARCELAFARRFGAAL